MSKVLFIEYCAKDFLDGTQNMDAETELAYRRIVDMIYATNDKLLDNDSLKYATKTGNKWKKIRQQLIEVHQKIYIEDGFIRNKKCIEKLQKSRTNIEQKSAAGKSSAQKRKPLKNNKTGSTGVATAAPTNQKPNNQLKEKINKKENPLWFNGEVIRLNETDFYSWYDRYPGNEGQFYNWLSNRDDWLSDQPPEFSKRWFISTSKELEKMEFSE